MLQRVVALDSSFYKDACQIFVETLERPDWAHEMAAENVNHLLYLANFLNRHEPYQELAAELLAEAGALREEMVQRGEASASDMAAVAAQHAAAGEFETAVLLFREALATNYEHIGWRLALSDTLVKLERYEEAFREARTCLRIRPGNASAKRRMEKISLLIPAPGASFQLPPSKASSLKATSFEAIDDPAIIDLP